MIEALEQRIQTLVACEAHLVTENGALRHANHAMAETVTALNAANERLVAEVAASNEQLGITQQERDNLRAQHNQALVFITTVRGVLNELVFGDTAEAERARIIFADKYQKRVATALAEGRISCPLDESAEFMGAFPGPHESFGSSSMPSTTTTLAGRPTLRNRFLCEVNARGHANV